MHFSAWDYVVSALAAVGPRRRVLEIGARDVNGSVRRLFGGCEEYVGLDVAEGEGVDVVGFPAEFAAKNPGRFDCVVSTETLEHDPDPAATIAAARLALAKDGGVLILTTAGVGRKPHSGVDGGPLREGEHYANIEAAALHRWLLVAFGEGRFKIDNWGRDIRATAWTGAAPGWACEAATAEVERWVQAVAAVQFPR